MPRRFLLILLTPLWLSSCGKNENSKVPAGIELLPGNCDLVIRIDLSRLQESEGFRAFLEYVRSFPLGEMALRMEDRLREQTGFDFSSLEQAYIGSVRGGKGVPGSLYLVLLGNPSEIGFENPLPARSRIRISGKQGKDGSFAFSPEAGLVILGSDANAAERMFRIREKREAGFTSQIPDASFHANSLWGWLREIERREAELMRLLFSNALEEGEQERFLHLLMGLQELGIGFDSSPEPSIALFAAFEDPVSAEEIALLLPEFLIALLRSVSDAQPEILKIREPLEHLLSGALATVSGNRVSLVLKPLPLNSLKDLVNLDRERTEIIQKWKKARKDLRNVAVALETYQMDHGAYPPARGAGFSVLPVLLTTPVAYAKALPSDPFSDQEPPFFYATDGENCWIAGSPGPDGEWDCFPLDFLKPPKRCDWRAFVSHFGRGGEAIVYDPSNGAFSPGDVLIWGP